MLSTVSTIYFIDLRTGSFGIDEGLHDSLLFHLRRFNVCGSMGLVAAFGQC